MTTQQRARRVTAGAVQRGRRGGAPAATAGLLCAVTAVVLAGCTGRPPAPPAVVGAVTASPTCPVVRPDEPPCPPAPVAGLVELHRADGTVAASARTDGAGRYAVAVSPGTYRVTVDTGARWPECPPTTVVVPDGRPVRHDIGCGTGIR